MQCFRLGSPVGRGATSQDRDGRRERLRRVSEDGSGGECLALNMLSLGGQSLKSWG